MMVDFVRMRMSLLQNAVEQCQGFKASNAPSQCSATIACGSTTSTADSVDLNAMASYGSVRECGNERVSRNAKSNCIPKVISPQCKLNTRIPEYVQSPSKRTRQKFQKNISLTNNAKPLIWLSSKQWMFGSNCWKRVAMNVRAPSINGPTVMHLLVAMKTRFVSDQSCSMGRQSLHLQTQR